MAAMASVGVPLMFGQSAAPTEHGHTTRALPQRLARRAYRHMPTWAREASYRSLRLLALLYRRTVLRSTTFIGVTGSGGKTTTKDLIALALEPLGCTKSPEGWNNKGGVAWSTLLARPHRRFHVQEVAIGQSSFPIEDSLPVLSSKVAVVTAIGTDHVKLYGSIEGIAEEKGKLVATLPPDGTAILNADDPRVAAMAASCPGRVVTFGRSDGCTFRAVDVRADWPERLSFTLQYEGTSVPVRTALVGRVGLTAVLAAISTATVLGMPLPEAVRRVERFQPMPSRMEPVVRPDGVAFVRDLAKAPLWHFEQNFDFLRRARAERRILVIGTLSDYRGKGGPTYSRLARQALDVADFVLFVGVHGNQARKALAHPGGDRLRLFATAAQAKAFLGAELRRGDLVLIKGNERLDDLAGLVDAGPEHAVPTPVAHHGDSPLLIVGLGNARPGLEDTPHNVGWRAVEAVAAAEGTDWRTVEHGSLARLRGGAAVLVKLKGSINDSGPNLLAFCREQRLDPTRCLLVHDDLDLPLGTARAAEAGFDAGHRGLRSAILALGTDVFPRVRIGIKLPAPTAPVARYVVTTFRPEHRAAADAGCRRAVELVLKRLDALPGKAAVPIPLPTARRPQPVKVAAEERRLRVG